MKLIDQFKSIPLSVLIKVTFFTGVFLVSFFNIHSSTFDTKINLGGDNANYYILGKSLSQGKGYRSINSPKESLHNHFPPGYPAFIATVMKLSGSESILTVKRGNRLVFFLGLVALFFLTYRITKNGYLGFTVSMLCMMNYHLLEYSTIMMSEVFFFFLSSLIFLSATYYSFNKKFYKQEAFYIVLILSVLLFYTRTQGVAMIIAILLFLLVKRNFQAAVAFLVGFFLAALPWSLRSKSLGGNPYMKQLLSINPYRLDLGQVGLVDLLERMWRNFQRYVCVEIPDSMFAFFSTYKYKNTYDFSINEWCFGLLLLGLIFFGIYKLRQHQLLILAYIGGNFGIFLLWPDVWFGIRFVLPLVPVMLLLIFYALYEIISYGLEKMGIQKELRLYLPLVFLLLSFKFLGSADSNTLDIERLKSNKMGSYNQNFANYFTIGNWLNQNTKDSSVIVCRKPALLYVFANRKTVGYRSTSNISEVLKGMDINKATHVIYDRLGYSSTNRYLLPVIQSNGEKFQKIHSEGDSISETILMQYYPERGYTGEYDKDGKRNGKGKCVYKDAVYEGDWVAGTREGVGTYLWNVNGMVYEGDWKNNLREGYGKLNFPNRSTFEGYWSNDKKHGKGKESFNDGGVLTSEWKNGFQEGYGEYRKGAVFYKGFWKNYKLVKK